MERYFKNDKQRDAPGWLSMLTVFASMEKYKMTNNEFLQS